MQADRYGLALSTASAVARDVYVDGCDLLLTAFPGAVVALDHAIDADPGFASAHVAKARAQQLGSDMAGARASLAAAEALADGLPAREHSQIEVFRLILNGQSAAALARVRAHLDAWPRDSLVLSTTANQIGLIGMSGRPGRERELVDLLDSLATHYGDDWWFNAHHAMALSETSQQAAARPKIERSLAQNPRNAYAAHAFGHLCYEEDEHDAAIAFMRSWLPHYPREGIVRGHLHWHLALSELRAGNMAEAFRLYDEAFGADDYPGPAMLKLVDAASFLWRSELAGHPRDAVRWRAMHDFAHRICPQPGIPMADWHVGLTDAVAGDGDALEERAREMETMLQDGRFPRGPAVPALLRGFAAFQRQNYEAAIDAIERMLPEREPICGSRAQVDLVEFTLLKAYLNAGRLDDARRFLSQRRPGPAGVPVAGMHLMH